MSLEANPQRPGTEVSEKVKPKVILDPSMYDPTKPITELMRQHGIEVGEAIQLSETIYIYLGGSAFFGHLANANE